MKSEDARFEDAFDQIMRWYRDESGRYQLSDSLQQRLDRWKSAREWILTYRPLTDSATVQFIIKTHQVSEPQAWRDVRDTKRFFASMEKTDKEFDRIMLVADVRSLRAKAEMEGDLKVSAACNATLQRMGVGDEVQAVSSVGKKIQLLISFNPKLIGAKEIPNLLETVEKFIGENARRELMIQDEDFIDIDGKRAH